MRKVPEVLEDLMLATRRCHVTQNSNSRDYTYTLYAFGTKQLRFDEVIGLYFDDGSNRIYKENR